MASRSAVKKPGTSGSGLASSPLPFPAGGGFHRDLQREKRNKQSILFLYFLQIYSLRFLKQFLLFFPVAKLLVMVGFGPDLSLWGGGANRGYGEADVAVAAVFFG